jgi:hypothetical protein
VFDRAGKAVRVRKLRTLIADSARFGTILDHYGFALTD